MILEDKEMSDTIIFFSEIIRKKSVELEVEVNKNTIDEQLVFDLCCDIHVAQRNIRKRLNK